MNTELFDVKTADTLEADHRLVDFLMPEEVPASGAHRNRLVGRRRAQGAPVRKPDSRPVRRRVALAAGLVVFLLATAFGLLAFDDIRADMAGQKRGITELVGRAEDAENDLAELRRREQDATQENGALKRQLSELEGVVSDRLDVPRVAERVRASVVTVTTPRSLGSGFVVRSNDHASYIVTNYHVIADVTKHGGSVVVRVRGHTGPMEATLVSTRENEDLALLYVTVSLPALAGSTANAVVGEPVVVAGSPHGLDGTVTSGIVSAERPVLGMKMIQISAPTSPGNSGGPVFDRFGKVIGVVTLKDAAPGAEGLSFAIPFNRVCPALGIC